MKMIPVVPPVFCTDVHGKPWPGTENQKVLTRGEFLRDQIGQDGFAGSRKGADQVRFQIAVLNAIDSVGDESPLPLEDEQHAAIARSIDRAEFAPAVAHKLLPLIEAILNASSG